ncbi:MAG: ATP synthase subunit I [Pyrinomonadaceae bacterium]
MADKPESGGTYWQDPVIMERRIFQVMCALNVLAVLVSAPLLPWRYTTGFVLGGVLAWQNYRWLRSSISAAFGSVATGKKPDVGLMRFVLRYVALSATVTAAYLLEVVSVPATLLAMSSFAFAAMLEGFIQTYFIVMHKEGN